MIGTFSLVALSLANRRAALGFAPRRDAWGRGYVQEMLTALVAWAFGPLWLHRLEPEVDPRNEGSIRALERLGFRVEGRLRDRWQVTG